MHHCWRADRSRRACRARSSAGGEFARVPAGASRRDRRSVHREHLEVTNRRLGSLGHGEPRERCSRDRERREQRPCGHCRGSDGPSCHGAVRRRCAVYGPRGRGPTSDAAARRRRYARSAVAAPRIRGPDPSRRTRCPHCGVAEGVGEVALSDSDGCDFVEIRERAGHLNSLKPSSLCRCLTTLCSRGLVTRSEDYAPGAWSWSGRLAPAHRRPAPTRTGHRRGQGCDRIADTL